MGCDGSIQEKAFMKPRGHKFEQGAKISKKIDNKNQYLPINVASISLGEYLSPFEYFYKNYDDASDRVKLQSEEYQLSIKFAELKKAHNFRKRNGMLFGLKKRNQRLLKLHQLSIRQVRRLTPIYRRYSKKNKSIVVGIKEHSKGQSLMNQDQFRASWRKFFKDILNQKKAGTKQICELLSQSTNKPGEFDNDILKQLEDFDTICYQTLLQYVYSDEIKKMQSEQQARIKAENQKLEAKQEKKVSQFMTCHRTRIKKIVQNNTGYKYKAFMETSFKNKDFGIEEKIKKVSYFAHKQKLDIIFLQQVSKDSIYVILKFLGNYRIIQDNSTAVLIHENLSNKLTKKDKNLLLKGLNEGEIGEKLIGKGYKNKKVNLISDKPTSSQLNQLQETPVSTLPIASVADFSTKMKLEKLKNQILVEAGLLKVQKDQQLKTQPQTQKVNDPQENKHHVDRSLVSKVAYREGTTQARFGQDSVVQFIGNLILVSTHIQTDDKSYSIKNLKDDMNFFMVQFPGRQIIVGVNSEGGDHSRKSIDQMKPFRFQEEDEEDYVYEEDNKDFKFYFSPNIYEAIPNILDNQKCVVDNQKLKKLAYKKGFFTSFTKKTQFHFSVDDSQKQNMSVNSFIISSQKIIDDKISHCNSSSINEASLFYTNKQYLPNPTHPFSDFFICAKLQIEIEKQDPQEQNQSDQDQIKAIEEQEEIQEQNQSDDIDDDNR